MKTKQIKYIWEVSRGQRGRILLSCLTGIIGVAVSLVFIYASKVVIDIATGAAIGSLTNAAILTIALLIAQLLCGAVDTWLSTRMQVETGNALRHRLFSRLLQSRWNELERFHTGDIVNRAFLVVCHLCFLLFSQQFRLFSLLCNFFQNLICCYIFPACLCI